MKNNTSSIFKERWVREICGLIIIAVSIYVFISMISFDPELSWKDQPRSYTGIAGSYLAGQIFWAIGYGGYLLPIACLYPGILLLIRLEIKRRYSRLTGIVLIFLSLAGLLSRYYFIRGEIATHKGGWIGYQIFSILDKYTGRVGSYLVLTAVLIISILLVTHIPFARIFEILKKLYLSIMNKFQQREEIQIVESNIPVIREPEQMTEPVIVKEPPATTQAAPERISHQDLMEAGLSFQEEFDFTKYSTRFQLPPISLLKTPPYIERRKIREDLKANSELLIKKLSDFEVEGRIAHVHPGPVVTRYEFEPAPGIKINQIVNLADDLALAMKVGNVRVVAPIPGRGTVGIEVPNSEHATVYVREILMSTEFRDSKSKLTIALGKEISGLPFVTDLSAMPHLLIAGATGSGKSVALNAMIISILFKGTPADVRFIMVDPKRLELGGYDGIPHLLAPVVTDMKKAAGALKWAVSEMEERYKILAPKGVRDIDAYNQVVDKDERLPYIIITIDELADLMMVSSTEVEDSLARLAQMARAVGIHLILSTQRPSVDVITGVIKANFPARISFQVATKVDSRTILDMNGAEQLLGKGDMLFLPASSSRPIRIHGSYISPGEIHKVIDFLKRQQEADYDEALVNHEHTMLAGDEEIESLYKEAIKLVITTRQASISYLQRRLRLGYPKAARFIDMMEQDGIIGPGEGAKPREILVGLEYLHKRGIK